MIHATTITGYHFDGDTYCRNCIEQDYFKRYGKRWREQLEHELETSDAGVIYYGDLFRDKLSCSNCLEHIDTQTVHDNEDAEEENSVELGTFEYIEKSLNEIAEGTVVIPKNQVLWTGEHLDEQLTIVEGILKHASIPYEVKQTNENIIITCDSLGKGYLLTMAAHCIAVLNKNQTAILPNHDPELRNLLIYILEAQGCAVGYDVRPVITLY